MIDLDGYALQQTVQQSRNFKILRGRRLVDEKALLFKIPAAPRPPVEILKQLENEWDTASRLDSVWIIQPLEFKRAADTAVLILEDYGGVPIPEVASEPLLPGDFLRTAISLASALDAVHHHRVIHKDLKPDSIFIHPHSRQLKITNFGIASRLPRSFQTLQHPKLLEGSLPYLSPEQTGRMSRPIDYRTDFYSLGITFYELLTGRLPFQAEDPLGWVHAHLARLPESPSALRPGIPGMISDIVLKLMAKEAEDRYQTALGLKRDLEQCLIPWQHTGAIASFPLGEHDRAERFNPPQKLYGREQEARTLADKFQEVASRGQTQLVLVSGYSGIGKSSLVHELLRPVVRVRGLFLAGKFDQFQRDVPYATLAQALRDLIRQQLAEDEAQIDRQRRKLLGVLGMNGQLLVEIIPELEKVIGPQPPVVELPLTEAQHRFHKTFASFLGVFIQNERPLVLFLDDLQWADPASLKLIQYLVTLPSLRGMLLVGAYRDNEVGSSHPLWLALEEIRKTSAQVHHVVLGPLTFQSLNELVADALHSSRPEVESLTRLVQVKTGGNPFFVTQFLLRLFEDQLIFFDRERSRWVWDLPSIEAQGYTANVVELMVQKLQRLPLATQEALRLAACLGVSFELGILATLMKVSENEVEKRFIKALEEGLVGGQAPHYHFLHDRIQQAAYSLLPQQDRPSLHLQIGRVLLQQTVPEYLDENLFQIVGHLNQGIDLMLDSAERLRLAELNLQAGRRAKMATAYKSAVPYFTQGQQLLPAQSWDTHYELTFSLFLERATAEWLTSNFTEADRILRQVMPRARSTIDQARVYRIKTELHQTQGEVHRSVETSIECLKLFGLELTPHPAWDQVLAVCQQVWLHLGDRPIEALLDLPPMTDAERQAAMEALAALYAPAYFTDMHLQYLVPSLMVKLSLQHGNTEASTMGYAAFGRLLGPAFGQYEEGYRFGKVGFDLVERNRILSYKARVCDLFGISTTFWVRPLQEGLNYAQLAFQTGTATGDLTYACYACMHIVNYRLARGEPLDEVWRESERLIEFVEEAQFDEVRDIIISLKQLVQSLRGQTEEVSTFTGGQFDEQVFEKHLREHHSGFGISWYYKLKCQGRVFSGDFAEAVQAASMAEPVLAAYPTQLTYPQFYFYAALAWAGNFHNVSASQQPSCLEKLRAYQQKFELWAQHGPMNYTHSRALVSAELARLEGRDQEAMRLYETAIRAAHDHGFVQDEALAHERAAEFYRQRHFSTIAEAYGRQTRHSYGRWQARGKVAQLDRRYPQLAGPPSHSFEGTLALPPEQIDLVAVLKASQAISGEIVLRDLEQKLLQILVEQAGAQSGVLVRFKEDGWFVEAEVAGNSASPASQHQGPASEIVPSSIMNYVQRARERVLLEDATRPNLFSEDDYLRQHRPRSVLALPILRQEELLAAIYLENKVVSGAFSAPRLAVLDLLTSQIAISLQNARLFEEIRQWSETLERRVRERTKALQEANASLEGFSYTVSHDLQAPLRHISSFAKLLSEHAAPVLDEKSRRYVRIIYEGAQRMGQLIDGLLALSRLDRATLDFSDLSLGQLVEEVRQELAPQIEGRDIEWQIGPLPRVRGDRTLLRNVIANLLSNAVKYTRARAPARIQIGSQEKENELICWVRDNGAGFDLSMAGTLFGPFQRLHPKEEFEGLGLGLASVRRIIELHGGRVWAEGEVNQGAAFYFSLPLERKIGGENVPVRRD